MTNPTTSSRLFTSAGFLVLLCATGSMGVEPVKSLVTGKPVAKLAVGGKLDIDLHAVFMVSRTFDKDTALHWYNCGYSGGGRNNTVGGSFGDFGLHAPHNEKPLTPGPPTHGHAESKYVSVNCPTFPHQRNGRHIL